MNISAPNAPAGQIQGTVKNATALYSTDSGHVDSASVVVLALNNTEAHWDPLTTNTGQVGPYRTGIQICGTTVPALATNSLPATPNDAFVWQQNATNTDLVSHGIPMFQNGVSETAVDFTTTPASQPYTLANSVLKSTRVDLQVWNHCLRGQTFSIKLVRANTNIAVRSANWGEATQYAAKNIRVLTNSMSFTNEQEFSTLWTHTIQMPGLRAGTPLKKYKITKSFSLDYLRSAYRKVFPAESSSLTKLAMQAEPSYAYDPGCKFLHPGP